MDIKTLVKQLHLEIFYYRFRYYIMDDPIISDIQYDKLEKLLLSIEGIYPEYCCKQSPTHTIGFPITGILNGLDINIIDLNTMSLNNFLDLIDEYNPEFGVKI